MPRPKLSNISTSVLQSEIKRRMAVLPRLIAQRDELDRQIADLQMLEVLSPAPAAGPVKGAGRKPGRRAGKATGKPLGQYVAEALAAAPQGLGVKEIESAVRKAGYPTSAESIYNPIMKAVAKGGFKKVGRGVYAAKAGGAAVAKAPRKGAKPAKAAKAPKAGKKPGRKRGKFGQNATEFALGVIGAKGATSAELKRAWQSAGRGGKVDNVLSLLVKGGKLKREKQAGGKGSVYTVA